MAPHGKPPGPRLPGGDRTGETEMRATFLGMDWDQKRITEDPRMPRPEERDTNPEDDKTARPKGCCVSPEDDQI